MTKHAVVIAGGGPTGLMLAAELALARVDVAVVERRETQDLVGARAGGLHARTIEIFDQRGIADRLLARGKTGHVIPLSAEIPLDLSDFPTRHNYYLAIWQSQTEQVMADWVAELPVTFYRAREVIGFAQDDTGVDVELSDGATLRADYLVGCDGGRSVIRKRTGIEFAGWDAATSFLNAEATFSQEPPWGMRRDERGVYAIGKIDGGRARIVLREQSVDRDGEPTARDVSDALIGLYGSDFGVRDVTWITRFSDATRQAVAYRDRRVLLAGDAAHIHAPSGGQGLNLGVQDAVNLGWKLARVVSGSAPDSLLDTYQRERHPIDARALRMTMAITALGRSEPRIDALRDVVGDVMRVPEVRKRYAGILSGLDVHYYLGEGHPLLGRRMPDLDIVTDAGPTRVYSLLHDARPVLLDFAGALGIRASYAGAWELPVIGAVAAPSAVLIRPDGYVAWVGDGSDRGLRDARALTG